MDNETSHNPEPAQEIAAVNAEKPDQNQIDQQKRDARIQQIDQELTEFSVKAQTEDEINAVQEKRDQEYQNKILELETGLGQPLSEETKTQIHRNMVDGVIEWAQRENEKFDQLLTEKTILEYLNKTLDSEKTESFIEKPMGKDCKVAVLVPAYNESASEVLRTISSLSEQEGVDPNLFEVDFVINNKKIDADQKSAAFLANQESINLIKFINGESQNIPNGLTAEQIKQVEDIKKSQIKINVIDKSSANTADQENNVGIARNRAGAEIINRFITSSDKKSDGVIALTDSDCVFSKNYIKSLIESFEHHKINGVSGNLKFEIDSSLPNQELIQKAFDFCMGINKGDDKAEKYKDQPSFTTKKELEKRDGKKSKVLQAGADMAVSARAWAQVGGVPKKFGGSDIQFGKNIEELKGDVAKEFKYTITSLMRVSERAGLQAVGRIVKKIKESVDDFVSGNSDKIMVEDRETVRNFYGSIVKANKEKALTGATIAGLMKEYHFKPSTIPDSNYSELADEINKELQRPESDQDFNKIEGLISEKIYDYYPEKSYHLSDND